MAEESYFSPVTPRGSWHCASDRVDSSQTDSKQLNQSTAVSVPMTVIAVCLSFLLCHCIAACSISTPPLYQITRLPTTSVHFPSSLSQSHTNTLGRLRSSLASEPWSPADNLRRCRPPCNPPSSSAGAWLLPPQSGLSAARQGQCAVPIGRGAAGRVAGGEGGAAATRGR